MLNRRSLIAAAVALPGAAQAAPDPTFQLIEAHRATHALWDAAVLEMDRQHLAGHKCRDDVACGNLDCIYHREFELMVRVSEIEERLRSEVPPTLAGLRAMVAHLHRYPDAVEQDVPDVLAMIVAALDAHLPAAPPLPAPRRGVGGRDRF